jgi:hypothetical protein
VKTTITGMKRTTTQAVQCLEEDRIGYQGEVTSATAEAEGVHRITSADEGWEV